MRNNHSALIKRKRYVKMDLCVLQLAVISIINYEFLGSSACTSRSQPMYRYFGDYTAANDEPQKVLLSAGKFLARSLSSFTQGLLSPQNDNENVGRNVEVRPEKFEHKMDINATEISTSSSPMQLLTSISNILNMVASRIFPKINFSWISTTPADRKTEEEINNDEIRIKDFTGNATELNSTQTLSFENTSTSSNTSADRRVFIEDSLTQLQMMHTDPLNATKKLLLPIYSMFKPADNPCHTGDDKLEEGMCVAPEKCRRLGGQTFGECDGGKCCLISKSCGETMRERRATFKSPLYPKTFFPSHVHSKTNENVNHKPFLCRLKIEKIKQTICQIYLHFNKFEIRGLDGAVCRRDTFKVKGVNSELPPICGKNNGQHVYLDVDKNRSTVELQFSIDTNHVEGRKWNIQIQQIGCEESSALVPSGCLQYHTMTSGLISSLNYGDAMLEATAGYPPGLNYAICIHKVAESCSIRFEPRGTFQVDVSSSLPGLVPQDFICRNDYLLIPNSRPILTPIGNTFDRFCGSGFPPLIRSRSGPYILQFVSDNAGYMDGGFQILFEQELC